MKKSKKRAVFLHKIICCGCVLESPRSGDSNTHPQHMILWRTDGNLGKNRTIIYFYERNMITERLT